MKTSIRIFLGSVSLLGIGLLVYDLQLNAAYRLRDYEKPFDNFAILNFRDFDRISLNSGGMINVMLEQGDFKVKANPFISDWLEVRQEGRQLLLTAKFPSHHSGYRNDTYALYISCPHLREITTDGRYFIRGVETADTNDRNLFYLPTLIKGFQLDSLTVNEKYGGNLVMEDNRIGRLRGIVGGGSGFTIGNHNEIDSGDLSVRPRSQLILRDTSKLKLGYHIAGDAIVTLHGEAARQFLK
jgi:hypothetical protein